MCCPGLWQNNSALQPVVLLSTCLQVLAPHERHPGGEGSWWKRQGGGGRVNTVVHGGECCSSCPCTHLLLPWVEEVYPRQPQTFSNSQSGPPCKECSVAAVYCLIEHLLCWEWCTFFFCGTASTPSAIPRQQATGLHHRVHQAPGGGGCGGPRKWMSKFDTGTKTTEEAFAWTLRNCTACTFTRRLRFAATFGCQVAIRRRQAGHSPQSRLSVA